MHPTNGDDYLLQCSQRDILFVVLNISLTSAILGEDTGALCTLCEDPCVYERWGDVRVQGFCMRGMDIDVPCTICGVRFWLVPTCKGEQKWKF